MNEKLAKKLEKILSKAGLEEDKIAAIIEEVIKATTEEGDEKNPNPDVPPSNEDENLEGAGQSGEGEGDVPPEGDLPTPPAEEAVPPSLDLPPEGQVPPGIEVPPEGDVPPEVPPAPAIDPTIVDQLVKELGEATKTIDGLTARIESLEEALKGAGVITSDSKVGEDKPNVTPNASAEQFDAFDDILGVINGK